MVYYCIHMAMTKQEACEIFGGSQSAVARALGLKRAAISRWPDELTTEQTDRVIGAAIRMGKPIPARVTVHIVPAAVAVAQ